MRFFWSILLSIVIAGSPVAAESSPDRKALQTTGETAAVPSQKEKLDTLYGRLASTQDEEEAQGILRQIERLRLLSGSPTADLLMDRVGQLILHNDLPLASELIERVLLLMPQWSEAWYRRAILFHLTGDIERTSVALLKTLSVDPRHIPALEMLGDLYSGDGDEKNALYIYRQALALYPGSQDLQDITKRLSLKVEGKEL